MDNSENRYSTLMQGSTLQANKCTAEELSILDTKQVHVQMHVSYYQNTAQLESFEEKQTIQHVHLK